MDGSNAFEITFPCCGGATSHAKCQDVSHLISTWYRIYAPTTSLFSHESLTLTMIYSRTPGEQKNITNPKLRFTGPRTLASATDRLGAWEPGPRLGRSVTYLIRSSIRVCIYLGPSIYSVTVSSWTWIWKDYDDVSHVNLYDIRGVSTFLISSIFLLTTVVFSSCHEVRKHGFIPLRVMLEGLVLEIHQQQTSWDFILPAAETYCQIFFILRTCGIWYSRSRGHSTPNPTNLEPTCRWNCYWTLWMLSSQD